MNNKLATFSAKQCSDWNFLDLSANCKIQLVKYDLYPDNDLSTKNPNFIDIIFLKKNCLKISQNYKLQIWHVINIYIYE